MKYLCMRKVKISMEYFIVFILIALFIVGTTIGITLEKKGFNNGICPHCNNKMRNFDTDSQGGRGYCCECGYHTWVSYKCVDKKFLIES